MASMEHHIDRSTVRILWMGHILVISWKLHDPGFMWIALPSWQPCIWLLITHLKNAMQKKDTVLYCGEEPISCHGAGWKIPQCHDVPSCNLQLSRCSHVFPYIFWLVVYLPLWKNDGVNVSWDDDIPNWMESHKIHVPNHQAVLSFLSHVFHMYVDSPLIYPNISGNDNVMEI